MDNTPNQQSKFITKNWFEINDDSGGTYNTNSQIKFKTSMLKSRFYEYSDAYVLVTGNITIAGVGVTKALGQTERTNKQDLFKNCAPFIDCITEINNTQVDNKKDLDVVMLKIIQKHL